MSEDKKKDTFSSCFYDWRYKNPISLLFFKMLERNILLLYKEIVYCATNESQEQLIRRVIGNSAKIQVLKTLYSLEAFDLESERKISTSQKDNNEENNER